MKNPFRHPILPLLIGSLGCRVSYLPPASSRVDGGPVSARGVISQEARSHVRLYQDAAGCRSVQTENRQFRVVPITGDGPIRTLVLEEAYDIRHCLEGGSVSTEATITAWEPDTQATHPLYRISALASNGTALGNLYRLTTTGCCGSRLLAFYYSLQNGKLLFTSSGRPIAVDVNTGDRSSRLLVAFHDTFSAANPPEATNPTVIGVLQWGGDRDPGDRMAVTATRPEPFALERLGFGRRGVALSDTVVAIRADDPRELEVRVELVGQTTRRRIVLTVPLENGRLKAWAAKVPAGFSASMAPPLREP